MTVTLVINRWQSRPEPKWILLRKETREAVATAKRITIGSGSFKKVFDRETGREIVRKDWQRMYQYSIEIPVKD